VGFACGDVVIEKILKNFNLWPELNPTPTKVLITIFDESLYREALQFTRRLREAKIPTELYLTPAKLDKQLKYADKKSIPYVVILGPDEVKNETVTLKNLKTGKQETISQSKTIRKLASK